MEGRSIPSEPDNEKVVPTMTSRQVNETKSQGCDLPAESPSKRLTSSRPFRSSSFSSSLTFIDVGVGGEEFGKLPVVAKYAASGCCGRVRVRGFSRKVVETVRHSNGSKKLRRRKAFDTV